MLTIESIPAFNDNYIWLIHKDANHCVVVDPGDATPVLTYLQTHDMTLDAILITHHHADHIGGISELKRQFPRCHVIGPAQDPIPGLTQAVDEGDHIDIFGESFEVWHIPGHTQGHIGYIGDNKLFCGDTLFSAGCGRLLGGTAEQLFTSLQRLAQLPDETAVYCAHEYTSSNIAFALAAEPDNIALQTYRDEVNQLRAKGLGTIPTQIGTEKAVNPFLRCDQEEVRKSVTEHIHIEENLEIFTQLRRWKDNF
uniref:hydroxyacylglutathione hydrolase n=1 Tax=Thaumasiovibrio occultus TaxID=1891184 RepID=UPI000B34BEBF|nr:hydroxyacylglutathione hydrolase [Thaumasiovibrio occultus]